MDNRAHYIMALRLRVSAVIEGLRLFWPYDELKQVRYYYEYAEFPEAISVACAGARFYGYGTVQAEMLALANELGEHDFTAFSPHPYVRTPDVPVEEVPDSLPEDPAADPRVEGGDRPDGADSCEGPAASG